MQASGPSLYDEDDTPALHPTYDALVASLADDAVVILDGLSELLSIGFESSEVFRFVRAVQVQTREVSLALIPGFLLIQATRSPHQYAPRWPARRHTPSRA